MSAPGNITLSTWVKVTLPAWAVLGGVVLFREGATEPFGFSRRTWVPFLAMRSSFEARRWAFLVSYPCNPRTAVEFGTPGLEESASPARNGPRAPRVRRIFYDSERRSMARAGRPGGGGPLRRGTDDASGPDDESSRSISFRHHPCGGSARGAA